MWKKYIFPVSVCALSVFLAPMADAQKFQSTPVDLSNFWNAEGWYHDEGDDPTQGSNHESDPGGIWTLDNGDARVQISTLPDTVVPGQVNVTEDGVIAFLLPVK